MASDYYDRQGNPMTFDQWCASYESRKDRRVARAVLASGRVVSTVHLGLNHAYGDGPPLIFESMVFPCDANGKVTDFGGLDAERYSTEAKALAGHQQLCEKWSQPEAK